MTSLIFLKDLEKYLKSIGDLLADIAKEIVCPPFLLPPISLANVRRNVLRTSNLYSLGLFITAYIPSSPNSLNRSSRSGAKTQVRQIRFGIG